MKFFLIAILLGTSWLQADIFRIGGVDVKIPHPEGYSIIPENISKLQCYFSDEIDPYNKTIAVYITDGALEEFAKTGDCEIEKHLRLKVNNKIQDRNIEDEYFMEFKRIINSESDETTDEFQGKLNEVAKKTRGENKNLTSNKDKIKNIQIVMERPHYEDDKSISLIVGRIITVESDEGESTLISVATITFIHLNKRIFAITAEAPLKEVEWMQKVSKKWADSILASN